MKMMANFLFIYVVIVGHWFVAAREEKILSKSVIPRGAIHADVSYQQFTSIDRDAFQNLTEIVSLNLAGNHINELPEGAFSTLDTLTNLNLSGNLIRDTTDAFIGLNNLTDLDISNNKLRNLGSNSLAGLTSQCVIRMGVENLYMSVDIAGDAFGSERSTPPRNVTPVVAGIANPNNSTSSSAPEKFVFEACVRNSTLVQLNIRNNTNEKPTSDCSRVSEKDHMLQLDMMSISKFDKNWYRVTDDVAMSANVTGMWLSLGWSNLISDLVSELPVHFKKLVIDTGSITRLKKGDLKHNGVIELILRFLGINVIEPGAFDMPKLKILNLDINRLEDTDTLKNLPPTIEMLTLKQNGITAITANSFSHLKHLKKLYIIDNRINTIAPGAFEHLDNLESLSLRENSITDIKLGTSDMINVKELFLEYNRLFNISSLATLPSNIEVLNLNFNKITELKANSFSHLKNLKELYLGANEINNIELGAFQNLYNLKSLFLRYNEITHIIPGTFEMLNVEKLDLGLNQMDTISSLPPTVKDLNLKSNAITAITDHSFSNLTNLKTLNIDKNIISTIDLGAFKQLESLEVLSLAGNEITDIEPGTFKMLKHLKTLKLNNNQIRSIDSLPPSIEMFSLNGNNITAITVDSFSHLSNLTSLYLRENKITTIEVGAFKHLQNVKYFDLSDNRISKLEANVFTGLRNLRELFLRRNSLTRLTADTLDLPELVHLDLSFNSIKNIEKGAFKNSRQLCKLYLVDNLIEKLENGQLFGLRKTSPCYVSVSSGRVNTLEGGVFDNV